MLLAYPFPVGPALRLAQYLLRNHPLHTSDHRDGMCARGVAKQEVRSPKWISLQVACAGTSTFKNLQQPGTQPAGWSVKKSQEMRTAFQSLSSMDTWGNEVCWNRVPEAEYIQIRYDEHTSCVLTLAKFIDRVCRLNSQLQLKTLCPSLQLATNSTSHKLQQISTKIP